MSKIIGTILSIEEYLSPKRTVLSTRTEAHNTPNIVLNEDRTYEIPLYQREIRWTTDNVNRLLSDLISGPIFLGNIILSISPNKYEIIDGQQRTTVIFLIIQYIKKLYGTQIEIFDMCKIKNCSFEGLSILLEKFFLGDELTDNEKEKITTSDYYRQFDRYKSLWDALSQSDIVNNKKNAKNLVKNLKQSELNVIASNSTGEDTSIHYFLDVNLKGVKLDTEDIFKGYLFSQDSSEDIRKLWQKNKQISHEINSNKDSKDGYPLMKLYEHYFHCELIKEKPEYSQIQFGTDFCITKQIVINSDTYYKGTHLIEVLSDKEYMRCVLNKCFTCMEIIHNIISNSSANNSFKSRFSCNSDIDSIEYDIFFNMMRIVLLGKDLVPKTLILKYILDYLDENEHTKKDYQSLYTIFGASITFTIFASKKENDVFYALVSQDHFVNQTAKWLFDYYNSISINIGKLRAAYKCIEELDSADTNINYIRCKSLAIVLGFLTVSRNKNEYNVIVGNKEKMREFLCNSTLYSIEHFIIAKSGKLSIQTEKFGKITYKYSRNTTRFRNSIFNYIFIPKELNNNINTQNPFEKARILYEKESEISSKYSKTFLKTLCSFDPQSNKLEKTCFKQYPTNYDSFSSEEELRKALDDYFNQTFANDFLSFSTKLVQEMTIIK